MAELAAASSGLIMVDAWETTQPEWQRSLAVMQRIRSELEAALPPPPQLQPEKAMPPYPGAHPSPAERV